MTAGRLSGLGARLCDITAKRSCQGLNHRPSSTGQSVRYGRKTATPPICFIFCASARNQLNSNALYFSDEEMRCGIVDCNFGSISRLLS